MMEVVIKLQKVLTPSGYREILAIQLASIAI